jgi:GGDEF domain-containing protein
MTAEQLMREVNCRARYVGEELIILLPEPDTEVARIRLKRIGEGLANKPLKNKEDNDSLIASIGNTQFKNKIQKAFGCAVEAICKVKKWSKSMYSLSII